jgi:uncharacterized protein YycO
MNLTTIVHKVVELLSRLVAWFSRPDVIITDEDVRSICATIKDGDALITRTNYQMSNLVEYILTGSFYGHAAIYLNGYVYEATTHGVRRETLERFCYSKDGIGICTLPGPDWTGIQVALMQSFCMAQFGEPYDYSFDWWTDKKWYCSKLVFKAWVEARPEAARAVRVTQVLDSATVTPQNIWDSTVQIKTYGVTQ